MRVLFFLLFPIFLSAQINRAYGVIEIGSFPTSSSTGPKFAYRPADSSFYRWISGNTWVKIVEPSIDPDTLYLKQLSGTTALVDGDTIDISTYLLKSDTASMLTPYIRLTGYGLSKLTTHTLQVDTSLISTKIYTNRFLLKSDTASMLLNYPSTVGYGIIDGGKTWRADTTSPNGLATRLFAKTLPTSIASGYIATSNGSNLVARNLFDNNTIVSILNSKPFIFGSQSVAGLPTGVDGYWLDVSNYKWLARYNSTAGAWIYPMQSSITGGLGTSGSIVFLDANGRATQDNTNLFYNSSVYSIRLGASSGADRIEFGANNGSGIPYITLFNAGLSSATITLSNSTTSLQLNTGLDVSGAITTTSRFKSVGLTSYGTGQTTTGQSIGGELILRPNAGNPGFINFTENGGAYWSNMGVDNGNGDFKYETSPSNEANWETGTTRFVIKQNGRVGIGSSTTVNYSLEQTGQTDAFGIARGTVAQRPTIAASTTPIRYNIDSTALEYGESVGTWRQLASRAYARSLVAGLGTGTVTSVGLSLPSIFSVSGSPVTTSGTLSATFTGGTSSLFLRGDGRWMKSLYFNSSDSVQFNITDPYFGSTALMSLKGGDSGFDSRFNVADYGYVNQALAIATQDDARYNFDRSRGTIASPTVLLKDDRIGGFYFRPHNGTTYQKSAYIGAIVDSIHAGSNINSKLIFGVSEANSAETSSYWRFLIEAKRNISILDHVVGRNFGIGLSTSVSVAETIPIDARLHVKGTGTTTDKTILLEDSGGADILTVTDNKTIQAHGYGTGAKEATDLSKTESPYVSVFATDGTVLDKKFLMPSANAYDGTSTGVFNDDFVLGMQASGANNYGLSYVDSTGYFEISGYNNSSSNYAKVYGNGGDGTKYLNLRIKSGTQIHAFDMDLSSMVYNTDNINEIFKADSSGVIRFSQYGTGIKEAADLSKTQSNYIASFATDGTVLDLERKRDTTIYVTDADYNFASAITSTQVLARYNRIIIYSKLTASATSDNQIILPSASSDFLQCTISVYSNDASGDADATSIDFTTNGAVDGVGGTVSTYSMSGGQKVEIRPVNDSGFKWIFN